MGWLPWTDDRVDELRRLIAQGLTASGIAAALGGVSRNGVIGKAHRLKLSLRNGYYGPATVQRVIAAPVKPPPLPNRGGGLKQLMKPERLRAKAVAIERTRAKLTVVPPAFHAEPVTLIDLRSCHCRWPMWGAEKPDPERAFYCGGFAPIGRTYCDAHHARAAGRVLADGEKARAA